MLLLSDLKRGQRSTTAKLLGRLSFVKVVLCRVGLCSCGLPVFGCVYYSVICGGLCLKYLIRLYTVFWLH